MVLQYEPGPALVFPYSEGPCTLLTECNRENRDCSRGGFLPVCRRSDEPVVAAGEALPTRPDSSVHVQKRHVSKPVIKIN